MDPEILGKMKRGVFYPGHHLGRREDLVRLVDDGYLQRMDASFLCGPDSEPTYCLSDKGWRFRQEQGRRASPRDAEP